mmetsp:Transcript_64034/g.122143  ORF Transcript_64034/g.122143 Transcript_64034/m.122143 type:complete len:344 (+) Transcript_64034:456-1487(+)
MILIFSNVLASIKLLQSLKTPTTTAGTFTKIFTPFVSGQCFLKTLDDSCTAFGGGPNFAVLRSTIWHMSSGPPRLNLILLKACSLSQKLKRTNPGMSLRRDSASCPLGVIATTTGRPTRSVPPNMPAVAKRSPTSAKLSSASSSIRSSARKTNVSARRSAALSRHPPSARKCFRSTMSVASPGSSISTPQKVRRGRCSAFSERRACTLWQISGMRLLNSSRRTLSGCPSLSRYSIEMSLSLELTSTSVAPTRPPALALSAPASTVSRCQSAGCTSWACSLVVSTSALAPFFATGCRDVPLAAEAAVTVEKLLVFSAEPSCKSGAAPGTAAAPPSRSSCVGGAL